MTGLRNTILVLIATLLAPLARGAGDIVLTANPQGITWVSGGGNNLVASFAAGATATGGTITNYTLTGTNYQAHIFTNDGVLTVFSDIAAETLIIGGGGPGACSRGYSHGTGGGGAGALIYTNTTIPAGVYDVVVGAGGPMRTIYGGGPNGSNSVFFGMTALGGGFGQANGNGGDGGSGGGCGAGGRIGGKAIVAGYGNDGGGNSLGGYIGSGGGGAGSKGTNSFTPITGPGGSGKSFDLSGELKWYAAGGGAGGGTNAPSLGGSGIGGNGGDGSNGTDGAAYTGSGGGGSAQLSYDGGAGGSGIVIIRYVKP